MSTIQNNAKIVTTVGQRIAALNKHVTAKTVLNINGKPMKLSDVLAVYQASLDTRSALVVQRAALEKSLDARDAAETTRLDVDKGLKAWVTGTFGPTSQEALEFGFLPAKVGTKSADTKATAVEKSLATREARGTRGRRQRQQIKGTTVAPAAPADPAVTTPAATPAVVASSPAAPSTHGPSPSGVAGSH